MHNSRRSKKNKIDVKKCAGLKTLQLIITEQGHKNSPLISFILPEKAFITKEHLFSVNFQLIGPIKFLSCNKLLGIALITELIY